MATTREFLADHGIETPGDWAALAMLVVTGLVFGVIGFVWFTG